jgi:hypothetical protein
MNDLIGKLSSLVPKGTKWVEEIEADILKNGIPLTPAQLDDARAMGVTHPDKIRLLIKSKIPFPDDPELAQAANESKLITEDTAGMCFRYGIIIRSDCASNRHLIAHECVHTGQYERLGGDISRFLQAYLFECVTPPWYPNGPIEQEAIKRSTACQ